MTHLTRTLALVIAAASGLAAHSAASAVDLSQFEIESRQRSKIVKMKAKQASTNAQNFDFTAGSGSEGDSECGSQNIGNVTTSKRAGPQPREIFVFAPNAINLVSGSGCR